MWSQEGAWFSPERRGLWETEPIAMAEPGGRRPRNSQPMEGTQAARRCGRGGATRTHGRPRDRNARLAPGGCSKPSVLGGWNVVSTSPRSAKSRDTSEPREDQLISRLRKAWPVPSRFFFETYRPASEEEEPPRPALLSEAGCPQRPERTLRW